jgi:hypothetical protein
MYLHMNALLFGTSMSAAFLMRNISPSILKSSGAQTPAPTNKVLRWKDLEDSGVDDLPGQDPSSVQSIFGTEEGERDLLIADGLWDEEDEELAV